MRYRRRPVIVDAVCYTHDTMTELSDLLQGRAWYIGDNQSLVVNGSLVANIGDWVVRDVIGKVSICEADKFSMTYERIG